MLLGGSRSMQGYDRINEDLDEYEEDVEDQYEDDDAEQYEDEEDEEEEKEEERVSEEAMKYLSLREKLKKKFRNISRRENGSLNNFGSFFGPSTPVIADRVIQESKSFLETRHLAPKASSSQNDVKKVSMPSTSGLKSGSSNKPLPKQIKTKAQIIKDTRDYAFLFSDDAELPKSTRDPGPQKNVASQTDTRSAQVQAKRNEPSAHSGRGGSNGYEQRKPSSGILKERAAQSGPSQKSNSGSRASLVSSDSRRQLDSKKQAQPSKQMSSSNLSRPRPAAPKVLPPKKPLSSSDKKTAVVSMVKKTPATPAGNKASAVAKNSTLDRQRLPVVKSQGSGVTNRLEHREVQRSSESKMLKKENVAASKYQSVKPTTQGSRGNLENGRYVKKQKPTGRVSDKLADAPNKDHNRKRRAAETFSDEDEFDYRSAIRSMFGYRPTRYSDDDDDDDCMEVGFDTIQREESRSARIARKEDEEEFIKIMEEERQERLRKQAKMRKMSRR